MNKFEGLKEHTVIVADTGEIDEIKKYHPTDNEPFSNSESLRN